MASGNEAATRRQLSGNKEAFYSLLMSLPDRRPHLPRKSLIPKGNLLLTLPATGGKLVREAGLMPKSYSKCQYVDTLTSMECDSWYVSEENQCFCPLHRSESLAVEEKKEVHIPRTVTVMNGDHIQALNAKVAECLQMSIPDLADHIRGIEDKIKELERDRRAANIAKRNLEDRLTDEEREALRSDTNKYKSGNEVERASKKPAKSPEEKAKSRKEGFSAWAARLGVKTEELMTMDDDEMAARIAKYKASKG